MRLRPAIASCVAVLALVLASPAVGVQSVVVQSTDTAQFPQVVLNIVVSPDAVSRPEDTPDVTVTENGVPVTDLSVSSLIEDRGPIDVVLLMDTSGSMRGRPMADAKAGAYRFVETMRPDDRIAVIAFSSEPTVIQGFTSDREALAAAIDGLVAAGETALYDGLVEAAALASTGATERYIVALSDGGDTQSLNPADHAANAVTGAGTPVYAVALESPEYNPATLETIASISGGRMTTASDSSSLTDIYNSIAQEMQLRYRVQFASGRPNTPELDLTLTVGSGSGAASTIVTVPNPLFVASAANPPVPFETPVADGFVLSLTLVTGFAAAALFVIAAALILRRDRAALNQLQYYDQLRATAATDGQMADETTTRGSLLTALGSIAERRGFTGLVQRWLDSAGLALRANEYIFFHVVGTITASLIVSLMTGGSAFAVFVAVVAAAIGPILFLRLKASRRVHDFEEQLPDILDLIAGSLRSGWGIQQAIDLVVDEVGSPANAEFQRTQAEARLGLPLEEALQRMADRVASADLRWAVSAIAIQREVGGNLAEVLNSVSHTIRERAELRRQVSALTAEGRVSLVVLTVLPFVIFAGLFVVNPEYMLLALETPVGLAALVFGALLLLVGLIWLNRVMKIEV